MKIKVNKMMRRSCASVFNSMSSNVQSHFLEKSLSECACTKLKPTCSNIVAQMHFFHSTIINLKFRFFFAAHLQQPWLFGHCSSILGHYVWKLLYNFQFFHHGHWQGPGKAYPLCQKEPKGWQSKRIHSQLERKSGRSSAHLEAHCRAHSAPRSNTQFSPETDSERENPWEYKFVAMQTLIVISTH